LSGRNGAAGECSRRHELRRQVGDDDFRFLFCPVLVVVVLVFRVL
jgi:hypothetical protein